MTIGQRKLRQFAAEIVKRAIDDVLSEGHPAFGSARHVVGLTSQEVAVLVAEVTRIRDAMETKAGDIAGMPNREIGPHWGTS